MSTKSTSILLKNNNNILKFTVCRPGVLQNGNILILIEENVNREWSQDFGARLQNGLESIGVTINKCDTVTVQNMGNEEQMVKIIREFEDIKYFLMIGNNPCYNSIMKNIKQRTDIRGNYKDYSKVWHHSFDFKLCLEINMQCRGINYGSPKNFPSETAFFHFVLSDYLISCETNCTKFEEPYIMLPYAIQGEKTCDQVLDHLCSKLTDELENKCFKKYIVTFENYQTKNSSDEIGLKMFEAVWKWIKFAEIGVAEIILEKRFQTDNNSIKACKVLRNNGTLNSEKMMEELELCRNCNQLRLTEDELTDLPEHIKLAIINFSNVWHNYDVMYKSLEKKFLDQENTDAIDFEVTDPVYPKIKQRNLVIDGEDFPIVLKNNSLEDEMLRMEMSRTWMSTEEEILYYDLLNKLKNSFNGFTVHESGILPDENILILIEAEIKDYIYANFGIMILAGLEAIGVTVKRCMTKIVDDMINEELVLTLIKNFANIKYFLIIGENSCYHNIMKSIKLKTGIHGNYKDYRNILRQTDDYFRLCLEINKQCQGTNYKCPEDFPNDTAFFHFILTDSQISGITNAMKFRPPHIMVPCLTSKGISYIQILDHLCSKLTGKLKNKCFKRFVVTFENYQTKNSSDEIATKMYETVTKWIAFAKIGVAEIVLEKSFQSNNTKILSCLALKYEGNLDSDKILELLQLCRNCSELRLTENEHTDLPEQIRQTIILFSNLERNYINHVLPVDRYLTDSDDGNDDVDVDELPYIDHP